jgi:hypothetical protein
MLSECPSMQGLIDALNIQNQKEFVKRESAWQVVIHITNTYYNVWRFLEELHHFPFAVYTRLLQAQSLVDGPDHIATRERLTKLLRAINRANSADLLQVLAHAAFWPLLLIESDDVSLLRLCGSFKM